LIKFTKTEIEKTIKKLSNWTYHDNAIHATFKFNNFKDTFFVMEQIALIAEKINHHPNWSNVYNVLKVSLTTHDAGGLTNKDFELAAMINGVVKKTLIKNYTII
jgi:4a-hydroxytetrahydrobiopterin dehydratase